jgi:hypothetical protein
MGHPLALGQVGEEPSGPVGVGALGAIRVVSGAEALSKLFERQQRTRVAAFVDGRTLRCAMPIGPLEEVNEVDAEGVFGLAHLPVFTAVALQFLAESAYLVSQGLVRGGSCQESADPAYAVRCRVLLDQLGLEDELAKLLQRRFELPHERTPLARRATDVPAMPPESEAPITLSAQVLAASVLADFSFRGHLLSWMSRAPAIGAVHLSQGLVCLGRRNQSVGRASMTPRKRPGWKELTAGLPPRTMAANGQVTGDAAASPRRRKDPLAPSTYTTLG